MELREDNGDWRAESKRHEWQYPLHLLKLRQSLVEADSVPLGAWRQRGQREPPTVPCGTMGAG